MTRELTKSSLSFVIVAFHNEPSSLAALCNHLLEVARDAGVPADVQLVVNDDSAINASTGVHVHQGHGNVGFARGVRMGVQAASGDYVISLNPDCWPDSHMLHAFLLALRPSCGILVPRLMDAAGDFDHYAYENWTFTPGRKWSERLCSRHLGDLPEGPLPTWAKAPGAFLGMERQVALDLGPFDDHFFLYAEDRDFSDRARTAGHTIRFLPHVEIQHIGGVSGTAVQPVVVASKADGYLRIASRRFGRIGVALAGLDVTLLAARSRLHGDKNGWRPSLRIVRRWIANRLAETDRLSFHSEPSPTDRHLRALVLWSDNCAANLGLRVLAQGSAHMLQAAAPHARVDWQDFGPGDSEVSFGTKAIIRDILLRRPITQKLRRYDVVVDSGAGDSFTDIYGLKRLSFIAYAHWRCRRLGVPLLMSPQTIGPFTTRVGRLIASRSIAQAAFIAARDQTSADYCLSEFRRAVDVVTTDLVFTLPPLPRHAQHDVLLNVSGLLWFGDAHGSSTSYRRATAELVQKLQAAGRTVALIGHVVHSPSGHDDLDAIAELRASSTAAAVCEVIDPQDLEDARHHIAGCRILIGARMHACLNALSQGVPAVPWAYSRKFAPLMDALGWQHVVDLKGGSDPVAETLRLLQQENSMVLEADRLPQTASALMAPAIDLLRPALNQDVGSGWLRR